MRPYLLLLLALTASNALAQPLGQGERDFAMSQLHATRKMVLDETAGLSPAQWNFKTSPERWSIAECVEHITLSEDSLFEMLQGKILKTPPAPEKRLVKPAEKDNKIWAALTSREQRANAPVALKPSGKWATPQAMLEHFKQSRDRVIAYVEKTPDALRNHSIPSQAFESMDGYQWILLIAGHSQRHVDQIREVKADAAYPKR